ncbi:MAG: hypothetical protein ABFS42_07450 [Candidatus Krumholzibacteriota bacterium]
MRFTGPGLHSATRFVLQTLVVVLLFAGMGETVSAAEETDLVHEPLSLIDFCIEDQRGKLRTSGYFRNSVVVLISGDRKGNSFREEWSPVLTDSLTAELKCYRVKFLPHAHLEGAPFFMKGTIRNKFSESPDEWVLMDWDGEFRKAYDLAEDRLSIVVFDALGTRRIQVAVQEFDGQVFHRTLAGIRELLQ